MFEDEEDEEFLGPKKKRQDSKTTPKTTIS